VTGVDVPVCGSGAPTSGGNCVPPPPKGYDPAETIQIGGVGTFNVAGFSKLPAADQQKTVDGLVASNWHTKIAVPLATGLAITLAISLAVYVLVRAIGSVIGGFAVS
jgi:hypothetical protein